MSMFGEIKCGRCDRHYSGARSKCPYCGARKSRSGRRLDTTDGNTKWKMVVGILLLFLIIVAVVVVILISAKQGDAPPASDLPSGQVSSSPTGGGIQSVETDPLTSPSVEPTPSVTPTPSPSPVVTDLILNRDDFTMSSLGSSWSLEPQLVPADADVEITWKSEDESVATVDAEGTVTAVGAGTTTVTATAGGITKECIVRVSLG